MAVYIYIYIHNAQPQLIRVRGEQMFLFVFVRFELSDAWKMCTCVVQCFDFEKKQLNSQHFEKTDVQNVCYTWLYACIYIYIYICSCIYINTYQPFAFASVPQLPPSKETTTPLDFGSVHPVDFIIV